MWTIAAANLPITINERKRGFQCSSSLVFLTVSVVQWWMVANDWRSSRPQWNRRKAMGTNGGKSMDNGLDDRGGEWLFQAVFCESGESGQMVDEGGVTGIQSGASGERDVAEDFVFTGIERLEDKARHREKCKLWMFSTKYELTLKSSSSGRRGRRWSQRGNRMILRHCQRDLRVQNKDQISEGCEGVIY